MQVVGFLAPFVFLGLVVLFIAFSGGPGRAREAYLTRGGGFFRIAIVTIFVGLGIAVPAVVIAGRDEATGGTPKLDDVDPSPAVDRGKTLFSQTCASCHSLAAVNARGVTGPDLDDIGQVSKERALNAIKIGGTGQDRMPAGLLTGEEAEDVAAFLEATAGKD